MLIDLLSPFLLHKWKDFLRPVMERVTIWSDKLKSSLLSHCHHSQPFASSAIMIIFLHWNHCGALPNTELKGARRRGCAVWHVGMSVISEIFNTANLELSFNLYIGVFLFYRGCSVHGWIKFPVLKSFDQMLLMCVCVCVTYFWRVP